ncbi:MAG: VWA domain-containing protein [Vicinamibacterales bacterium]
MRRPSIVITVVLLNAAVAGQQPRPTFSATTAYVRLDVVVTDAEGRPVTDLAATDFKVYERGQRQAIADFESVRIAAQLRPLDLSMPDAVESEVVGNAAPAARSRAIVLVVDEYSLKPEDIVPVQRALTTVLQGLAVEDHVALTYVSRSDLGQDFTTDIRRIARAAANFKTAVGAPSGSRGLTFVLRNVMRTIAAARHARRVVVLIGRGGAGPDDYLKEVFRLSKEIGVPIYTLDPTGLVAPELGFELSLEQQTPANRAALDKRRVAQQHSLRMIASNTGGQAFVNRWDVDRSVEELLTENGSYYVIGYYPARYQADGRFHPVRVEVDRPGLLVRARPGYISHRDAASSRATAVVRSLADGLPGGDLLLSALAVPLARSGKHVRTLLALDLDGSAGSAGDAFEVAWLALDGDARVRASGQRTFNAAMGQGRDGPRRVSIAELLLLPAERLTLRVAVSSRPQSIVGTVHLPVDLRTAGRDEIEVSPIVLGLARTERRHVMTEDAKQLLPFAPATERIFRNDEVLSIFARIVGPQEVQPQIELHLERQDGAIPRMPVIARSAATGNVIDVQASLPLANLGTGRYVLELRASGPAHERRSRVSFEIR